jgi:hypothetical protein
MALWSRLAEVDFKPPQAAVVKSYSCNVEEKLNEIRQD